MHHVNLLRYEGREEARDRAKLRRRRTSAFLKTLGGVVLFLIAVHALAEAVGVTFPNSAVCIMYDSALVGLGSWVRYRYLVNHA